MPLLPVELPFVLLRSRSAMRRPRPCSVKQKRLSPCPNRPRKWEQRLRKIKMRTENGQLARVPPVCLPVPVLYERLIPFFRIVGSLMEWSAGVISDRELCHALRKAAAEVDRGGF